MKIIPFSIKFFYLKFSCQFMMMCLMVRLKIEWPSVTSIPSAKPLLNTVPPFGNSISGESECSYDTFDTEEWRYRSNGKLRRCNPNRCR